MLYRPFMFNLDMPIRAREVFSGLIVVNISFLVSTRQRASLSKVRDRESRDRLILIVPLSNPEPHVFVYVEACDQLIKRVGDIGWLKYKTEEDLLE